RFGLGGVKGVGEGAVAAIVDEREKNGPYRDIYEFFARVNLNACNRKTLESLVLSGAFDSLGPETREQFFATNTKGESMLELLMRYGNHMQQSSNRNELTLFDVADITIDIPRPKFLPAVPWSTFERFRKEKELIGLYLTGHPLDAFAVEMELCSSTLADLPDAKSDAALADYMGKSFTVGGIISKVRTGMSRSNNPYMIFTLEDYTGNYEFALFGKQYQLHANEVTENLFVSLELSVQDRFADYKYKKNDASARPEMVIKRIELLSEMSKQHKELTLMLPVESVDVDLIACLESAEQPTSEVQEAQVQPSDLHVVLVDNATHHTVNLISRNPIYLTAGLIHYLRRKREQSVLNYRVHK
ncbi:MAG: hypothetical protein J6Z12_07580, partial [Paludibacteraceae bacterium]|nr:hypothetical protein [Paludibacteraceae bacterium]